MKAMVLLRAAAAVAVAALLSSCGGGGGGGGGGAPPNEIVCNPVETGYDEQLFNQSPGGGDGGGGGGAGAGAGAGTGEGAIQYAEVRLYDNTGALIGTALSDEKGLARLRSCGKSGPFRVEYVGTERTKYFDEGIAARTGSDAASWVPFGVGERITVHVTNLDNHVALTPLTNAAAAEIARVSGNVPPTAAIVIAANENARVRFNALFAGSGISVDDITQVPALAYSIESLTRFGTNGRGRYAQMLATLAKSAAQTNPSLPNPAREMNKQLTLDLSDGTVDGRDISGAPVAPEPLRAYLPQQVTATLAQQSAGRLNASSTGNGTVDRSVGATACSLGGGDCYPWSTVVTLTARPAAGFRFQGWSGACVGSNPVCSVTMSGDKNASATFVPLTSQSFSVSAQVSGNGSIASSTGGLSCPGVCSAQFTDGTVVTLNAIAAPGAAFTGWGGACSGTGACVLTVSGNQSVTASFGVATSYLLQLQKAGTSQGSVASSPAGISCGSNCTASFAPGAQVTLIAVPASGSTFAGWSGACTGAGASCSVDMTTARNVTATFNAVAAASQTLTVVKAGTGQGSITSNPAGINCGSVCSLGFAGDLSVTLTAAPDSGSTFAGWAGACTGTSTTCTVTMTAARSVTATFNLPSLGLTVSKAGTGQGTVTSNPSGINCGASCTAAYEPGTSVTLTASPASGSTFGGWAGACTGTATTCTVSMSAARSVTATFDLPGFMLTVSKAGTGQGTVVSNPTGINCGSSCVASYGSGTTVTLTASAATGSTFAGWTGACSGLLANCTVSMTAARSVTAVFNPSLTDLVLTVQKTGTGQGTVTSNPSGINCGTSCAAAYSPGLNVTLTASAGSGSVFAGWSGACSGSNSTCTVTMTAARSVTANFTLDSTSIVLTVVKAGTGSGTVRSDVGTIVCGSGSDCSAAYPSGTVVTLTATPDPGSVLASWTVGSNPGTVVTGNSRVSVSLTASTTVTATFTATTATWTWVNGSNLADAPGVYGIPTVLAASNVPGARWGMVQWTDSIGNLWMFGGNGRAESAFGYLNDVWRFVPSLGMWAWMSGPKTANGPGVYGTQGVAASGNVPGARSGATEWIDAAGQMWLFGGYGYGETGFGYLNDLWRFNPSTRLWTWVSGSKSIDAGGSYGSRGVSSATNLPSARGGSTSWIDAAGDLWLFGGFVRIANPTAEVCIAIYPSPCTGGTVSGHVNDVWRYRPSTGQWTWMGGSGSLDSAGVYGTLGIPSAGNMPGGRRLASSWIDPSGTVWLFAGWGLGESGSAGPLNDLWSFSPTTGQWRWVSGSKATNAAGVYGSLGQASASTVPGARIRQSSWVDASASLWVFGGFGPNGYLNDLWRYSPVTGQWAWVGGSSAPGAAGVYGAQGVASSSNVPGARGSAAAWFDTSGQVWLFGGETAGGEVLYNDLWRRGP